jgi:hypothetical protein
VQTVHRDSSYNCTAVECHLCNWRVAEAREEAELALVRTEMEAMLRSKIIGLMQSIRVEDSDSDLKTFMKEELAILKPKLALMRN